MVTIEQRNLGKNVETKIYRLFKDLEGCPFTLEETKVKKLFTFGKIEISIIATVELLLTTHLVSIKTENFSITSDMRYKEKNIEETFDSEKIKKLFSNLKIELTYSKNITFENGSISYVEKNENEVPAWQMPA